MNISINNNILLEPYKGGNKIEMEITKGFGTVKAKATLIPLKVVQDAIDKDGGSISKGSTVLIKEEILATRENYKKTYTVEGGKGEFVIGNILDIISINKKG